MTAFGGPEVLTVTERPDPTPGPGQVVLDLAFAEVLFLDTQLRRGWGQEYFPLSPPFVPGVGVSGVVRAAHDEDDRSWVGRRVVAGTSANGAYEGGGYADAVLLRADDLVEVPDAVGLDVALAALSDGVMGLSQTEHADLAPGDVAVVTGAAGAVASWVLPLAADAGARTVAVVGGGAKADLLRGRSADVVVDHDQPGLEEHVVEAARGGGRTVVFDGVGGSIGTRLAALLGPGDAVLTYGSASGDFADTSATAARGVRVVGLFDGARRERSSYVREGLAMLAAGTVVPLVGQVLPLSRAADAHRAIEDRRAVGKTLLRGGLVVEDRR